MKTSELKGLFLRGSLKNGVKFFGECLSTDDEFLTITTQPGDGEKAFKLIKISEVVELDAAPVRRTQ